MRGRLITLEGIEGVGKSTNLTFVVQHLRSQGIPVVETREPGGTPAAEAIRQVLLDQTQEHLGPLTELLLMFAARASHLEQTIGPALAAGDWVVCDRFTDASYAYQGGGRGLGSEAVAALEQLVQGSLRPDLTLLLDASPSATLERRMLRGTADRFEQENADFFARVRSVYLERAAAEPDRIRCVDASQPLEAVQSELAGILDSFYK